MVSCTIARYNKIIALLGSHLLKGLCKTARTEIKQSYLWLRDWLGSLFPSAGPFSYDWTVFWRRLRTADTSGTCGNGHARYKRNTCDILGTRTRSESSVNTCLVVLGQIHAKKCSWDKTNLQELHGTATRDSQAAASRTLITPSQPQDSCVPHQ